jgi:hypothetical protein
MWRENLLDYMNYNKWIAVDAVPLSNSFAHAKIVNRLLRARKIHGIPRADLVSNGDLSASLMSLRLRNSQLTAYVILTYISHQLSRNYRRNGEFGDFAGCERRSRRWRWEEAMRTSVLYRAPSGVPRPHISHLQELAGCRHG